MYSPSFSLNLPSLKLISPDDISFSDVSVVHNEAGRPELLIVGGARAALKELAGDDARVHLSVTDQDDYCAAMVVVEMK
jgi:phosphopantetheinyl transferase (holo-ACP synthase)